MKNVSLIHSEKSEKIRTLFDKIIKYVYESELFHFLTYIILNDKKDLFEMIDDITQNQILEMNLNFTNNFLDIFIKNIFKFEDLRRNPTNTNLDFGFVLALIYIINEFDDENLRKKIIDIFENINLQKNKIEILYSHYNSLLGLVSVKTEIKGINCLKEPRNILTDLIKLISDHKNEIIINKNNLEKIFNNSTLIDFDLYLLGFDYFIAFSDENSNFEAFNKVIKFIQRKISNKFTSKNSKNEKEKFNSGFKLEIFDLEKIKYIFSILFSEDIINNPNKIILQESVISNILDYFNKEENCLSYIIGKLIEFSKSNTEIKYSKRLILKLAQSNLLEQINFESNKNNTSSLQIIDNVKSNSNKKLNKDNNSLSNDSLFNFIDFINLLIEYDISTSEVSKVYKINFFELLNDFINKFNNVISHQNKTEIISGKININETIFYIFEFILKNDSFSLEYSLKTLEILEILANNNEINSNFLIMSNNLFVFLSNSDNESKGDKILKKIISEKIEKLILIVCEKLAKKQKNLNDDFYLNNQNKSFSHDVYQQVKKFESEEKIEEDFDNYEEEEKSNAMFYSYEYLNILNTLFLSLNKAIISLERNEFERDLVLRVIYKTFDIFSQNGNNNRDLNDSEMDCDNIIGYKFKKDIFSVILNSIINFIISLLGNHTEENKNLSIFYEYIQTLVKLTIVNFNDDTYLDNILKRLLDLLKPFDNRLISCLFVNLYYYSVENNYYRFLDKQGLSTKDKLLENFSKFYDQERDQNNYYNRIINSYFEEILELNLQKFDDNLIAKVLLILEEILFSISFIEEGNKNKFFFIISNNENENSSICFFENIRNLVINLNIKILSKIKSLFYLNDSQKLKQNEDVYKVVLSINNLMLKNYKLSNQIVNKNKEDKNVNTKKIKNHETNSMLTNIFNKNLKIFEENFFEIIIEANILHYLIINLYNNVDNEKEQILLRNFLLEKYLNLIRSDSESIQDSGIVNKNLAKAKKKAKNFESYQLKFNDNLIVFKNLLFNFDKENEKNYENINIIFSILTDIISFSEKFVKLNRSEITCLEIFNIIKESKRLDIIITNIIIDIQNKNLGLNYYVSKFSILNFMIKFFTSFELKFFDLFNKFIKNIDNYLDILFEKFFVNSNNNENKEIVLSLLKYLNNLVYSRSEFLSPIMETFIFKISLLYEENYSSEIIKKIFDTLSKKQLFDLNFKSVKFAFKNYDKIILEKNKISNDLISSDKNELSNNKHEVNISYRKISNKINSILEFFNNSIKYSDKLVITDMNLKIIKFIYRILIDKSYNNYNNNTRNPIKNNKDNSEESENNQLNDLSDNILICLKSLILKMNEKQLRILFEEFLFAFFKEEIDPKNPEDIDIENIGNKYKLNNCIVSLQVFNEIFECLNSIFVSYFEKYKNVLIQILNQVNSVFCSVNKNNSKKKKERDYFEEKFDDNNNKFTYLNLSNLAIKNISLAFKYDKNALMQETIEELFEPVSQQVIIYYINL